MHHEISHSPSFSVLDITLEEGETVIAQPNSMVSMTAGIKVSGRVGGHLGGGIKSGFKSVLSGEDFFTGVYTAKKSGEKLSLAPEAIGEIIPLEIDPEHGYYLTRGAFLASQDSVTIAVKYGGMKGWMAKKGLFFMHVSGSGFVFLSSFGAVIKKELQEGEKFIVDNRYVIAFRDTVAYELVKVTKELRHSIMSGEGLVNRYTGPGTLFYQTRSRQRSGGILTSLLNMAT